MSQPVVDTLELCDALRKTGMEHEQAEGVARALNKALGEHVVTDGAIQAGFQEVRSDVQAARAETQAAFQQARAETRAAFQQARTETQQVRTDLQAEIRAVDHKVDLVRSELGGRIDAVDSKLTFMVAGFGLVLTVLTVAGGMGLFQLAPT